MFAFLRERRQFADLRENVTRRAQSLSQQQGRLPNDILADLMTRSGVINVASAIGQDGKRGDLRTPRDLAPFVDLLLGLPSELSAWLTANIQPSLSRFGLPMSAGGDIMMAVENANYTLTDRLDAAARHLAMSLCLMPTLGMARNTLMELGSPIFPGNALGSRASQDTKGIEAAARQGFAPLSVRALGWNLEMRRAVVRELEAHDPRAGVLFRTALVLARSLPAMRAWPRPPRDEAVDLLNRGIDEAGSGHLEAAAETLKGALRADAMIASEALRNLAFVEAKQGNYASAVDHCREALKADADYAEVWYHLGICLAKLRRFADALKAFEKSKALGHSAGGLEPNIATCRRAMAAGHG